jgi:CTP:molybdopterin cytidylyltransferase MocA
MTDLALVMPMAGRGSRFARDGVATPKPLIELAGKPFFWWAVESVRRRVALRELLFVVLREHIESHAIDRVIADHYPRARIVAIEQPTAGAAETGAIGVAALAKDGPLAINDCDHAFRADALPALIQALEGDAAGALLGFRSASRTYE